LHTKELHDPLSYIFNQSNGNDYIENFFQKLAGIPSHAANQHTIAVAMGRSFTIPKYANGVGRFKFDDLCRAFVGAIDYMSLANACHTIFIEDVPRLNPSQYEDTRRFITLIDILYDARCNVVLSCECSVEDLFDESGSNNFLDSKKHQDSPEIYVSEEGGSSGRSTTMLGDNFEWSATGRMHASLAELSSKSDVSFALDRARSRLYEMQTQYYWDLTHQPIKTKL